MKNQHSENRNLGLLHLETAEATWDHFHLKPAHTKSIAYLSISKQKTPFLSPAFYSPFLFIFQTLVPLQAHFSSSPLNRTPSAPFPLYLPCSLCPSHLTNFWVPSPFSSKVTLKPQSITIFPGTTLGPSQLKTRSQKPLQASNACSPASMPTCINRHM